MRRILCPLAAMTAILASSPSAFAQPLARFVPGDRLVAYLEFDGTDAHAEAWGRTSASKILERTPTGVMIEDLLAQVLDRQFAAMNLPGKKPTGASMAALVKHAARSGFLIARNLNGDRGCTTLVFRGAMKPEARPIFEAFIDALRPADRLAIEVDKPGNRRMRLCPRPKGGPLNWWGEGDDLVFSADPDATIATLDGKRKSAADHPIRAELTRPEGVFQPLLVAFADAEASPALLEAIKASIKVDFKGVRRFDYRWGFDGDSLRDEFRLVAPAPRSGILTVFDQPRFDRASFPPLPPDAANFTILSIDPARLYGRIEALLTAASPKIGPAFRGMEATVHDLTGLRLREDMLAQVGPRMAFYASAAKKAPAFGLPTVGVQVPRGAFLLEMKDAAAVTRMMDTFCSLANKEIARRVGALPPPPADDARKPAATLEFRVVSQNPKTWALNLPTQWAVLTNLRPTIAIGKNYLVIATMPDAAKAALAAESRGNGEAPAGDAARSLAGLPQGLIFVNVADPRDRMPEELAKLPATLDTLLAFTPPPTPTVPPPLGDNKGAAIPNPKPADPPRAAPPSIRVDPSKIPKPEAIRPWLFPGSVAVAVDDRAIRISSRSAFPDVTGSLNTSLWLESLPNVFRNGMSRSVLPGTPAGGPPRPPAAR